MDEADAKASLPWSSSSMALSCSTSEYIVRLSKSDDSKPCSTALAMVPIPACSGSNALVRRPASTSPRRNVMIWPAMALVSSSGGKAVEGLSGSCVMTMAAILAGSTSMKGWPMRWSTDTRPIG
ncbi:hypothetical protein G6F68_017002 [Rhizopus microsporus]|nr:hypothetical protein G6F68_017002 [Rhizopus microsporus]